MTSRLIPSVGVTAWRSHARTSVIETPPLTNRAASGTGRRSLRAAAVKLRREEDLEKLEAEGGVSAATQGVPVVDLHAGAPPPGRESVWRDVRSWVVFSDLHVSTASLQVSLQVLRAVKEEAGRRNAGVLFLGDFWHHRGSLPVVPLNAVLDEFAEWTAPTLMLVGNHDQITAGGMLHALAPLQHCSPLIHVFDQPTLFMDALWLPYRRDPNVLSDAVSAAGDVKAIFAHVDVVGAYMNETFQARDGVQPQLFPGHIPTFTGHYHRRHKVQGTNILYVGSSYQVSRSEAGQDKALTVLDAAWQPIDVVPLDVGVRHFCLGGADAVGKDGRWPPIRRGDKVRLQLIDQHPSDEEQEAIDGILARGARVEVVAAQVIGKTRITEAEQLAPVPLFHKYAEAARLPQETIDLAVSVLQELGLGNQKSHHDLELHHLELKGFGPFLEPLQYNLKNLGLQVLVGQNLDDDGSDSNGAGKTALAMAPLWVLTGKLDGGRDGGGGRAATHADIVSDSAKSAAGKVQGVINGKPFTVERAITRRALSKLKFTLNGSDETQADSRMTQALIDKELGTALLMRTAFFSQNAATSLLDSSDKDFKLELGKVVDLDIWEVAKDRTAALLKEKKRVMDTLTGEVNGASLMQHRLQAQVVESGEHSAEWERCHCERLQMLAQDMDSLVRNIIKSASSAFSIAEMLACWTENSSFISDTGKHNFQRRANDAIGEKVEVAEARIAELELAEAEVRRASKELQSKFEEVSEHLRKAEILAARKKEKASVAEKQVENYSTLNNHDLEECMADRTGEDRSLSHSDEGAGLTCDRCLQPIDSEVFANTLNTMKVELGTLQRDSKAATAEVQRMQGDAVELQAQIALLSQQQRDAWREVQSAHEALRLAREEELREELAEERRAAEVASLRNACTETEEQIRESIRTVTGHLLGTKYDSLLQEAIQSAESHEKALAGGDAMTSVQMAGHSQLEGRRVVAELDRLLSSLLHQKHEMSQASATQNPYTMELARLEQLSNETESSLKAKQMELELLKTEIQGLIEVEKAFGRSGIPSYVLEGTLTELQNISATYLKAMSNTSSLTLSATKAVASGAKPGVAIEQITKMVQVRLPTGETVNRSLRQLSGGEKRRVALALCLGFTELASRRGCFKTNVLVLDEVLQHLDNNGCAAVASVLRSLSHDTILLIGQDNTFATESFDAIDVVTKEGGRSRVKMRNSNL